MAQPTIDGLTLNAGTGGASLGGDIVDSQFWQAVLVGFSTGDGTANVVMADAGLPVDVKNTSIPVAGMAAEGGAVSGNPVLAAGRYDSSERATDNGDATALAVTPAGWLKTAAAPQSSYVLDGNTICTVKRFSVVGTTSGNNALVAAVASKKIRLLSLAVFGTSGTATGIYLQNGDYNALGSSSAKVPIDVDSGSGPPGFVLPWNPGGWLQTDTADEALNAVADGTAPIIYCGSYIEVD